MAVIELGLVHHDGDEPATEPGRRPLRRSDLRRVLVALVAVCCVLTVTGSARPDPRGLARLWTTPFAQDTDTFRLAGGTVFVLSGQGDRRLSAYDSRTGAVRWSTAAIEQATWLTAVEDGVLLMPVGTVTITDQDSAGNVSSREFSRDTVAVDAATGRQLWRQRGEVTSAIGNRVLLSEWNATGEHAQRLRVVRLHDGGTIWSRAQVDLDSWMTDTLAGAQADRLVTVTAQGAVEVLSLADGSVVTTGKLPWTRRSSSDDYSSINVQGRRLYLDQTIANRSSVSVYDTETLTRLWRREQSSAGGSYPCGPVVCVTDAQGVAGHDSETGALRWRMPRATTGYPLLGDRLLVEENEATRRNLVDGRTGRVLADLGTAMPVWDSLGRGTPYLLDRTVDPPGRTAISRFDATTGEMLLQGAIEPVLDYGCQYEKELLACVTQDNRLTVTDVG
jgi:outer membrane protein assembly factor BamB